MVAKEIFFEYRRVYLVSIKNKFLNESLKYPLHNKR